jgi:four helix bundle protein
MLSHRLGSNQQPLRRIMTSEELKNRTKRFALDVIRLGDKLPQKKATEVIFGQLVRSATSVGANYRSACRARSQADFISKITIVEEEADESSYWIELLDESGLMNKEHLSNLLTEANELTAIFTASGRTAKTNRSNSQSTIRNPK